MADLSKFKIGKGNSEAELKATLKDRYQNVPSVDGKPIRKELSDKEIDELCKKHYPQEKKSDAKPVGVPSKSGTLNQKG